jgi:Conjugative transposon, TraM
MNNFFNLRLIKYPLSLLIIGIGVGIYLKIFPPKQDVVQTSFGGTPDMKFPKSDSTIGGKNIFSDAIDRVKSNGAQHDPVMGNDQDMVLQAKKDSIKRVRTEQERKATNERNRHNYNPNSYDNGYDNYRRQPNHYQSNYPPQTRPSRNIDNGYSNSYSVNADAENATIVKLRKRVAELEGKVKVDTLGKKQNETGKSSTNIQADKYDKNGFVNLDKLIIDNGGYSPTQSQSNGFYSNGRHGQMLMNATSPTANQAPASAYQLIKARLVEDKTVREGASLKMMVIEPTSVKGLTLEKGQIILGKCNINGDRLVIVVNGFIKEEQFYPLEGRVIDLDGGDGLSINAPVDAKLSKKAWGQNASSALGSMNPLLVYQPTGNIGTTVANQVVGSLVNQSLNGANQFVNGKINDIKANTKSGQLLYIQLKSR